MFPRERAAPLETLFKSHHVRALVPGAIQFSSSYDFLPRFLDVTSARVGAIEKHVFDGLTAMESLWLDENRIGLLPKSIFCGLEHLKELNLNSNR